jgi:hypothetical protein
MVRHANLVRQDNILRPVQKQNAPPVTLVNTLLQMALLVWTVPLVNTPKILLVILAFRVALVSILLSIVPLV